jgi:ParB-like nuclease domain/DNA methylase
MIDIERVPTDKLTSNPRNARTHSRKQIRQIADSIKAFGFVVPILVDDDGTILAGHGRHAAAKLLKLEVVPVIKLGGLSEAKRRALALADNRIAQNAGWDREVLAAELPELTELLLVEDLEVSITGFEPVEIDELAADFDDSSDRADAIDERWTAAAPVTKLGDLWHLGPHRILCGEPTSGDDLARLMGGARAAIALLDPTSELRRCGSELSRPKLVAVLKVILATAAEASEDSAVHFVFTDWRQIGELLEAAGTAYGRTLDVCAWVKSNPGPGSFYKSQHELIAVFQVRDSAAPAKIAAGKRSRSRSNVWQYPDPDPIRSHEFARPATAITVRPVAMIADALKDCSRGGEIVLDSGCGYGTTILAAERIGRRAYVLEREPHLVDLAIRRWQALTCRDAIHAENGTAFDEVVEKLGTAAVEPVRN